MKNFMVANQSKGRYKFKNIELLMKAQIENSLDLGWSPSDIILLSNFDFDYEFMGIKTIRADLNKNCLTGSKTFGMKYLFDENMVNDVIWAHDLDAWQNVFFECPDIKDVGITCYSSDKFNGGSIFWNKNSRDIIEKIVGIISDNNENKEEPTLNKILKSKQYKERVSIINRTYNVGCSGYAKRWDASIKPIRVCHFHPYNRLAWETHTLDRNGLDAKGISDRLESLLRKYYPWLAKELPEESKKCQAERRARRLRGLPVKPRKYKK